MNKGIENLIGEIWRPIKGYEGLYEVSNKGRIKALAKVTYHGSIVRKRPEMLLKQRVSKKGYLEVMLSKDSISKNYKVHRLVAEAFIENDDPINKTTVNHKDENKLNNCVENLEWMSSYDNYRYGTGQQRSIANRSGKLNGKARRIVQIDKNTNEIIRVFDYIKEAVEYLGVSTHANIVYCCQGKLKTAYGYKWGYLE